MSTPPNVLVLSGHDPSGGAGFQADIEAIGAMGAHGAGALTALTRQDTRNAYGVTPVPPVDFAAAMDTLLDDMTFAAAKVGLVGHPEQARAIAERIRSRRLPLVVDPVLRAGGGATLAADPVAGALAEHLFAAATILTPNAAEVRLICPRANSLDSCGKELSRQAEWVLVTGGDEPGDDVVNTLFRAGEIVRRDTWPRLGGRFHGAGCTLAAALAARLALGDDVPAAAQAAQRYTWGALSDGFAPGTGQTIPDRLGRARR